MYGLKGVSSSRFKEMTLCKPVHSRLNAINIDLRILVENSINVQNFDFFSEYLYFIEDWIYFQNLL